MKAEGFHGVKTFDCCQKRNAIVALALFFIRTRNFTVQPIDACKPSAEASKPARPHNGPTGMFNPPEGNVMKTRLSVIAIALSALVAGHAMAADQVVSKTREQVRAELMEAQRTGNIVADGETGMLLKDLYPSQYPKQAVAARAEAPTAVPAVAAQGKTRAQVRAELAEAQANGELIADGETGMRFKDLYPSQYPSQADVQAKSRDEVRAETQNAGKVKAN